MFQLIAIHIHIQTNKNWTENLHKKVEIGSIYALDVKHFPTDPLAR